MTIPFFQRKADLRYGAVPRLDEIMGELQGKFVLVVDDDPGMLRAMASVLARQGMQVTCVSDPVAVVKKLADPERRFDLVITDLRMPMFSGRAALALAGVLPICPVFIFKPLAGLVSKLQALGFAALAFSRNPFLLLNF